MGDNPKPQWKGFPNQTTETEAGDPLGPSEINWSETDKLSN